MASNVASTSKVVIGDAPTNTAQEPVVISPEPPSNVEKSTSWLPSRSLFESNPYFSAGFGLMVFGTALAVGRRGITLVAAQTQRRLLISLEIPSKDKAHPWFLQWMGAQAKAQAMRNAGLLPNRRESIREFAGLSSRRKELKEEEIENDPLRSGNTRASPIRIFSHELSVETTQSTLKNQQQTLNQNLSGKTGAKGDARFAFVPGPGTHWFRYKGCWMRVSRNARFAISSLQC